MKVRFGVLLVAVVLVSGVIVYDHRAKPLDFPTPVQGPTVSVTTTLPPPR